MDRSSRDPRRMSPRSVRRDRSFSRLAVACLRVISNDDTYNANDRQDILKQKCSGQTDGRSVKRAYVKECGIPNGPSGRFCSTKHVGQATPHENKKLMSGILRRKVARPCCCGCGCATGRRSRRRRISAHFRTHAAQFLSADIRKFIQVNGGRDRTRTCDLPRVKQNSPPNSLITSQIYSQRHLRS